MVTNGAAHSAADWAKTTANRIVKIDPSVHGERLKVAQAVRRAVIEVLGESYDRVRHAARREDVDRRAIATNVVSELFRVTRGTDWAQAMDHPAIRQAIFWEVVRALGSIILIERST